MEDTNIQNEQNQPVTPSRTVQFLHASPREMTKPLILRQPSKQAFAAIWLWVKVTTHGTSDSQSHESQTQVSRKEVLCIVRDVMDACLVRIISQGTRCGADFKHCR